MKLIDPHFQELKASGLTDETIQASGAFTETCQKKAATLLKWEKVPAKMLPGIVFPYTRADGANGYARLKPDHPRILGGKPVKYESPKGEPNEIYIPPRTFAALQAAHVDLLITEGEKKALCADQFGFFCIGLVGVHGWKPKKAVRLIPPLEQVAWRGRKVFIVFDSDVADNENVQAAESQLAHLLSQRGAVVRCVRLPLGPAGEDGKPTKVGLDDFIVAHGYESLFPLLKDAIEPDDVSPVEMKLQAAEMDPATEVRSYLKSGERDGVNRLVYWRGTFWLWRKGWYQELPASEVRSHLVAHLNQHFSRLTTGITANCMMQLQAQTLLGSYVQAPSWLPGTDGPFPAAETLICRNMMIHLPGYLEGAERPCRPLTPRLFSTSGLDFDFDRDAPQPAEWIKFLQSLWPNDPDSIDTLREWFGYCLLPDTSQHKILMLIGPKRSGKGTIARVLRRLVGERNSAAPTLASLGTNFGLQPLIGKTLAVIGDARLGGRADLPQITERLLSISGEDAQTIDRKGIEATTCTLPVRFVLLSNELPRLNDSSGALASRMILLRLTESFFGQEDKGLTDRLLAELPGILLWSITGWDRLRRRGYFEEPATAEDMRREFADLTSPILAFIRDCCFVGPEHETSRDGLYATYQEWCKRAGRQHVEDKAGFGRALHAALPQLKSGFRGSREEKERHYLGIIAKTGLGF